MQIFGKGNLEIDSEKSEAIVIIDLKLGEIIVQPQDNEILSKHYPSIFDTNISVSSFEATIREGKITSNKLPELFIKNYNQNHNILDSIPLRSFKFLENYKGNELILKPINSQLDFKFEPANANGGFTELHFINVNIPTLFDFNFGKAICSASLDKSGHAIIIVDKALNEQERGKLADIFRISCCLGQGGYSSVREIITPSDFTINLVGYDIAKPPFKLVSQADFEQLMNSVIASYKKLEKKELNRLRNALYYLEGGYKQTIHLEFRVISLFTAIEILDESARLDKSKLKRQFDDFPSLYDAAFMKEIRNQLIHNGLSIQEAITIAEETNYENDKDNSKILRLLEGNENQKQLVVYYFLLDLVTRYLHSKFEYRGDFKANFLRL